MFKITPVQSPETAREYLAACSAEYKNDCFVYAMKDYETDTLMGVAQFELNVDHGYIYDLKDVPSQNDFEAMFILGRQTMNFINSCGLNICKASLDAGDADLIKAIGFTKKENIYECNTDGMFDGTHCAGHK